LGKIEMSRKEIDEEGGKPQINEPSSELHHPARFLDIPEVLEHVFFPKVVRPGFLSGEIISIKVEKPVAIEGVLHFASISAPTIIFFHGNGETAYDYEDLGPIYASLGINLFVADYRGYGSSGGEPTYSAMLEDGELVLMELYRLRRERGLSGALFVMGRSLGSAPALELAGRFPSMIRGLIIESGFADTYRLLVTLGVDSRVLDPENELQVSNLQKMKNVAMPVLVIHGELDEIIPFSEGIDLYHASPAIDKEILLIPGAGHNTLFSLGLEEYLRAVSSFVHRLGGG
jgi:alpha-beta hydrolase superfamily lysophospholipase